MNWALLHVDEEQKNIISEIILLPGTIQGETHTIFKLHKMSIDFNIVGTIHSHSSPFPISSNADLEFLRKHGRINIIIANPYEYSPWNVCIYNG